MAKKAKGMGEMEGQGGACELCHVSVVAVLTSLPPLRLKDTFLDLEHLKSSFPGNELTVINNSAGSDIPVPPFRITFPWGSEVPRSEKEAAESGKRVVDEAEDLPKWSKPLIVESYTPPNPGPYPQDRRRTNSIRFTPVQVQAGGCFYPASWPSPASSPLASFLQCRLCLCCFAAPKKKKRHRRILDH